MNSVTTLIQNAAAEGNLSASSAENILRTLRDATSPVQTAAILELAQALEWAELNDRFYRTLAFGTGGLRGRSIGKVVPRAENGNPTTIGRPEFPCVGTNALNGFNISRATQGLAGYVREWAATSGLARRPSIVFAHDTRHFSREFAELAARVTRECGCDAYLFEGPRSTPELSFAVRNVGAQAGVVITASHNPPHDNGYKVYFDDGAQVVEPHASGIIARVDAATSDLFDAVPESEQGALHVLGKAMDDAYMARLETLLLQPDLVRTQGERFQIVFSAIHGTGGEISVPMLRRLGFNVSTVPEQDVQDGRFPTVKSPNPENAEALSLAVALANQIGAELVIATDPDSDRMGVAVRSTDGSMQLLTGNQIGSLMAWYRTTTLFALGILNDSNKARAVIIKTFVTTDLQKAIAEKLGVRCVETLTGFKYIGEKLGKYERAIPAALRADYAALSEIETRALRLEHSSYYVFGGEESYGYSGADFVRDKDANGAAVMFAEVAAYAKSRNITLPELLDEIYVTFGFHLEKNGSLTFEGAEGALKIKALVESYNAAPPHEIQSSRVIAMTDFQRDEIHDVEGDRIPAEKMLLFTLENGTRIAVRPSGTEPKIKYYLFAKATVDASTPLEALKPAIRAALDDLWTWLQADVEERLS